MNILQKINEYVNQWEIDFLNKLEFKDAEELANILNSRINESRKSQFVAKLIGLGILTKDEKTGKLKAVKNVSKDEVINMLQHQ